MLKSEMTCVTCIFGQPFKDDHQVTQVACRRKADFEDANPTNHWCGEGVWRKETEDEAGHPDFELVDWGYWDAEEGKEETAYGKTG